MNALELISQDLFDKVRSRFSNLQMGGEGGAVTVVPQEARFFDFDFVVENVNLGRVSISINDVGTLKVYYSQGIVEDRDSTTQQFWFDFLREMRQFAKRRMLRFDTRDISKGNLDKNDFAYLAQQQAAQQTQATQPTVPQEATMTTESTMYGSSKSSYRPLEKTLLIVRHNHKVGEDRGARSRSNNIQSIFIQNEAGERFKYPFVHMAGAKAMQRHVANGGTPFDTAGTAIVQMSEQIRQLSTFKRQVGNVESLTNEARGIVDRVGTKLSSLRNTIESITKQTRYQEWRESLEEAIAEFTDIDAATIEDYKSKFTVSSYKEDLTQYFPLLFKVMQETSTVDLEDYVGEGRGGYDPEQPDGGGAGAGDITTESCTCDDNEDECPVHGEKDVKEFTEFEEWTAEIAEGPKPSEVPTYQRDKQGKPRLTLKDLEDEESNGKISHPKTLAKNSGRDVKEGTTPGLQPDGKYYNKAGRLIGTWDGQTLTIDPAAKKYWIDEFGEEEADGIASRWQQQLEKAHAPSEDEIKYYANELEKSDLQANRPKQSRQQYYDLAVQMLKKQKGQQGLAEGGYYLSAEDLPDWTRDALNRVSKGEVKDWPELYGELSNFIDDEKKAELIAKRVWQKGGGEDTMAQHRMPGADMTGEIPGAGSEEDDDNSFLNKLRSQAKGGSIKPGVDTGGVEMEDMDQGALPKDAMTEIARIVMTSINRGVDPELVGTVPRGDEAIKIEVTKKYGEKAGELAEQLLQIKKEEIKREFESRQQMESMRRLAGLPPLTEAEKKTMSRAAKGWAKFGDGMIELSKAAKKGASEKKMDAIRKKHNKYDEARKGTGDVGKPNTGKNKGFAGVVANAKKSGYSDEVAKKIAGKVKKDIMAKK